MNSKNIVIGILVATTLGAGALAWQQYQRANATAAQTTKLAAERETFEKQIADQQHRIAELEARRGRNAPPDAAGGPPSGEPGEAPRNVQSRFANARAIFESPEASKLMASQQRGMLDGRYSQLFKSLNLSPDQLAKFKDLLVDKQNAARDILAVAREQGLDMRNNRDEIQQLIKQSTTEVDANIASLVGQDKFAQYQNYDQTQPQRNVVNQVEQRLSYTTEPLTSSQSEQLLNLLAQNSASPGEGTATNNRVFVASYSGPGGAMNFGGGMLPGMNLSSGVEVTDQVIQNAQSFLSVSQVDALRQMQAEQADQKKLQQLFMSNAGGGNDSGGGQRTRRNRGAQ